MHSRLDRRRHSERGMTILEGAVAAAVLALVFVSTLAAVQVGYGLTDAGRCADTASEVLQGRMEQIRGLNWSDVQAIGATWTPWTKVATIEAFAGTPDRFEYREHAVAVGRSRRQVEVQVRWTGRDGVVRERRFVNLFAQERASDYYYRR